MPLDDNDDKRPLTLAVILHAYTKTKADMKPFEALIEKTFPDRRVRFINKDMDARLLSTADPNDFVRMYLREIDAAVADLSAEEAEGLKIVFLGHSLGAVLARKLYVVACGETEDAPFEDVFRVRETDAGGRVARRAWADKVDRIVLLAAMNRGWRISHHISLWRAPLWIIGSAVGRAWEMCKGKTPLIFNIRKGAGFLTNLRIQWIKNHQRFNKKLKDQGHAEPMIIQALGSIDDMVSPEDNIDLVAGSNFFYLDVPHSGHANVIEIEDEEHGAGRRAVIETALRADRAQLESISVVPSDDPYPEPDETVENVIFVIHGIRDVGYWTHKVARRIKATMAKNTAVKRIATETSSYGFFPMLPFLFSFFRRDKVEWFMDQYAEALARYPEARFSFVGHSNGTYVLARALELYNCCHFENVVFAGSVVHRGYDWEKAMNGDGKNRGQVKRVLNLVATRDWVVAIFPKFFQVFGIEDLGSAGHDGFDQVKRNTEIREIRFLEGAHGAGTDERAWDAIAAFVSTGSAEPDLFVTRKKDRGNWVTLIGHAPYVAIAFIAAVLVAVWFMIQAAICALPLDLYQQGLWTGIAAAAYLLLIWKVVTSL